MREIKERHALLTGIMEESQTFSDSRRFSKFESPDGGRETQEGVAIGGDSFSET